MVAGDSSLSRLNPFAFAQQQVDEAAQMLKLAPAMHELLRWPMREFHFTLPIRMDDGTTKIFKAYRVQYNNARGPCKGGLRWHPDESIDLVRALASWMTWKTSLLDLPLGGGKGGIQCNPKFLSLAEKERLARAYIRAVGRELGVERDVPAPDVNTTPQIMAWSMDEYEVLLGEHHPAVITGKPLPLGGSLGRDNATSWGGLSVLREADRLMNLSCENARYAIQGFGNVGGGVAGLLHERGKKVVAISAEDGALYNEKGLDVPAAMAWYGQHGFRLEGCPIGAWITNDALLACDCDILIPAAIEQVITRSNAGDVKAKIIVELANGPTTPEADEILRKKGIPVIPDILANAGGVTVSYFEQVQNTYNYRWSVDDVRAQLDRRLSAAFAAVHEMAAQHGVTHRMGAYMVAVARVAEACRLRGWV
jgi:glutamate dehydrogenase (NAD(P)+)